MYHLSISPFNICRFNWSDPSYAKIALADADASEKYLKEASHPMNQTFHRCFAGSKTLKCADVIDEVDTDAGEFSSLIFVCGGA